MKMDRFKKWWKSLCWSLTIEEPEEEHYPYWKSEKDVSCQCPFCGYLGSADELRCHLLNYHKK